MLGHEDSLDIIDLRSDTVTLPTPAMRQAMADAELGDDVYSEDPTVNRLQEKAAALLGKDAGLFVASGTMSNLVAILAHCQRGDEVILGNLAHSFLFEAGGISALGGVHSCQILNQHDGTLNLDDILNAIRPDDSHFPRTRLVVLENTHNRCGGVPLGIEYTQSVADLVHDHDIKLHLDGARLFNAAVAMETDAKRLASPADSVSICLSKGLCAPVGSILCGSNEFIQQAHRIRKQLGGGMRQAGVLAAAGIVALDSMINRLAEDHENAKLLAEGLRHTPAINLDLGTPYTNMVYLKVDPEVASLSASQISTKLDQMGIKTGVVDQIRLRLVTHYWIKKEHIIRVIEAFNEIM